MLTSIKILKFIRENKDKSHINRFDIKPILDMETDDSTINYVKRTGGQINQFYKLGQSQQSVSKEWVYKDFIVINITKSELAQEVNTIGSLEIPLSKQTQDVNESQNIGTLGYKQINKYDYFVCIEDDLYTSFIVDLTLLKSKYKLNNSLLCVFDIFKLKRNSNYDVDVSAYLFINALYDLKTHNIKGNSKNKINIIKTVNYENNPSDIVSEPLTILYQDDVKEIRLL